MATQAKHVVIITDASQYFAAHGRRYPQGAMACTRCGDHYVPALPAPIDVYVAAGKAFMRDHRNCRPQEARER